jgi:hypothetical protein
MMMMMRVSSISPVLSFSPNTLSSLLLSLGPLSLLFF